ncbi:hypothetical protein [uncultured Desulfuromusa sp.]|uniref:hypothetical protein n=1 Tax=uncultured Desulfuromusa sp. TaxID=219183 RepID=UPI002AA83BEF|nr:hypothetical protein [uncultured Desulfuromusa sp.]
MAENMRRILIIEDDKNTANLVATYLQKEGYFALVENDGVNGLQGRQRRATRSGYSGSDVTGD